MCDVLRRAVHGDEPACDVVLKSLVDAALNVHHPDSIVHFRRTIANLNAAEHKTETKRRVAAKIFLLCAMLTLPVELGPSAMERLRGACEVQNEPFVRSFLSTVAVKTAKLGRDATDATIFEFAVFCAQTYDTT